MRNVLLACAAALIVGLLLLLERGRAPSASPPAPASGTGARLLANTDAPIRDAMLDPSRGAARSGAGPAARPAPASDSFDLRAVLAAVARAEGAGDGPGLEALLARIVGDRARLQDVIAILESDDAGTSSVVRRGGVVAIAVAFARWSRGGGSAGFDATDFCDSVLQSLPRQPAETRSTLVAFLVGTDHGGLPAIPGSMLPAILSLCRQHPEDAALYAQLLEQVGQDPRALENHRAELVALVLSGGEDPLVGPALRALLALDPESGAATARSLLDDAPKGSELRGLIVEAIAASAPPSIAVETLVTAASGTEYEAFQRLASRPEAREEVRNRYSALVAANLDARARKNLVASMSREETGTLLGIAATDPHPEVRRQAFLTATVSRDVGLEGLRAVRDAYERRGEHGGIDARCAAISASNVLLKSSGAAREDALGLLGQIARDARVPLAERRLAWSRLKPHVPRETVADLEALESGGTPYGVR